jgi:hypothetical protein
VIGDNLLVKKFIRGSGKKKDEGPKPEAGQLSSQSGVRMWIVLSHPHVPEECATLMRWRHLCCQDWHHMKGLLRPALRLSWGWSAPNILILITAFSIRNSSRHTSETESQQDSKLCYLCNAGYY